MSTHTDQFPTDCQCMHGTDITVLQARAWLARLITLSSYLESQNTTQEETPNSKTNCVTKFCCILRVPLGMVRLDSFSPVLWDCDCGRRLALWCCRLWLGRCWFVVNLRFGAAGAHFFSIVLAQIMICEGGAGSPFSCANDFLINTRKNFKYSAVKLFKYKRIQIMKQSLAGSWRLKC